MACSLPLAVDVAVFFHFFDAVGSEYAALFAGKTAWSLIILYVWI